MERVRPVFGIEPAAKGVGCWWRAEESIHNHRPSYATVGHHHVMSVESFMLYLLLASMLVAHIATLRILSACERRLSGIAPEASSLLDGVLSDSTESINLQMSEVCRIGADIADLIEALVDANSGAQMASASAPTSIQETIVQLMMDKFLASNHANTEQQRPIYEQQEASSSDNDLDENEQTPE